MLADTLKYSTITLIGVLLLAQGAGKLTPEALQLRGAIPAAPSAVLPPAGQPRAAFVPAATPADKPFSALDEYRIQADSRGHFFDNALVNGQQIRVLVDTGASSVALSYEDASSLMIFPLDSEFTLAVNTANGVARAAPVKLREVQLGEIKLYDVDAMVAERGVMSGTLLGMTFLSRLSHVEMASGSLLLRK